MALAIPPLQTIQIQMEEVCTAWKIPFLNISGITNPEDIPEKNNQLKPKVLLASIEDVYREEIQDQLHMLDIVYVAVDECQVGGSSTIYLKYLYLLPKKNLKTNENGSEHLEAYANRKEQNPVEKQKNILPETPK